MSDTTHRSAKHIGFRLAEMDDAEFILSLRLDSGKNRFLSPVEDSIDAQRKWLAEYKKREEARQEYYYIVIDDDQTRLGTVRLYDFKGDSFCWGSWILVDGTPAYAAIESALTVYETAFYTLGFNRSHFDVRKENRKVVDFHRKFGATVTGEDELNFYFDISKDTYERTKKRYKKFLSA